MVKLLLELWSFFEFKRKLWFLFLLFLMIIASLAEMVSIGAALPFLISLTDPNTLFKNELASPIIARFGILRAEDLITPLTVSFCIAAVFSGVLRLLVLWMNARFSVSTGSFISNKLYVNLIYQSYSIQINRNSSSMIGVITNKVNSVIGIILNVANFFSSVLMLLIVLGSFAIALPEIALPTFLGFTFVYVIILGLTKGKLKKASEDIAFSTTRMIHILQESFGGIRDILISSLQSIYVTEYKKSDLKLRKAQGSNYFIGQFPRFVVESIGLVLIAVFAFYFIQKAENGKLFIPVLGMITLGAQRILPVLQTAYASISGIRGEQIALMDVLRLLNETNTSINRERYTSGSLDFHNTLEFNNVSFKYTSDGKHILKNICFSITKGQSIGVIGKTGAGKSTFIDILMGLLIPTDGQLIVDGVVLNETNVGLWQSNIAHVPQNIFLIDSTIKDNIIFSRKGDVFDENLFKKVCYWARVDEFANNLELQYETKVGERGINLSGGQRQRIGIARALYKGAKVLVFDEATSSLDSATEDFIVESISGISTGITIIMIAHRITSLKTCDSIIEINESGVINRGQFSDLM